MLFRFFIWYQYVASRCVLGNFDLKVKKITTVVYNSRIETDIGVPVNQIKNIFTLTS